MVKDMNVHFSSKTDDWATPQDFFDAVVRKYGEFDLDACADAQNAKCPKFFTRTDNALIRDWSGRVWMNPPYGARIGLFVEKAYRESLKGAFVVCLLPARTDTAWFHAWAMKGEITFIPGRLKFGGSETSAPFPSCLVVFGNKT